MNEEELIKRYEVVTDCWKFLKEHCRIEDSDDYWQKVLDESNKLYEKHGKTAFVKEQVVSVVNELDRYFKEKNGGKIYEQKRSIRN